MSTKITRLGEYFEKKIIRKAASENHAMINSMYRAAEDLNIAVRGTIYNDQLDNSNPKERISKAKAQQMATNLWMGIANLNRKAFRQGMMSDEIFPWVDRARKVMGPIGAASLPNVYDKNTVSKAIGKLNAAIDDWENHAMAGEWIDPVMRDAPRGAAAVSRPEQQANFPPKPPMQARDDTKAIFERSTNPIDRGFKNP